MFNEEIEALFGDKPYQQAQDVAHEDPPKGSLGRSLANMVRELDWFNIEVASSMSENNIMCLTQFFLKGTELKQPSSNEQAQKSATESLQ